MADLPDRLPLPWHWDDVDLTPQLRRELPQGHILYNKKLRSVGRRQDNDDALFELEDDENKYAVVHLTWSQKQSTDINYPKTKPYKSFQTLLKERILADHEGWENEPY